MDIFKVASQLAKNISDDDKSAMENMDMEKMISHVTQSVFKMMGNKDSDVGAPDIMSLMKGGGIFGNAVETVESENISDSEINLDDSVILRKTRDICFDLNVDLEDFYLGKKKKLNVKRKRIIEVDGKQKVVEEKKKLIIPIEKGMKDEQQIRFEGEADQIPGYKPGDIVITLIENEHPVFQRDNDNLIIVKNINLYELFDITFDITHLDERILRIIKNPNDSLHLDDSLRKIPGEGMPIYKNDSEKGDLFIRFNLVIPKTIDQSKLNLLKDIFESENVLSETFTKKYLLENVSDTDIEDLESEESYESDSESDSDLSTLSESSDSEVSEVSEKKVSKKRSKNK